MRNSILQGMNSDIRPIQELTSWRPWLPACIPDLVWKKRAEEPDPAYPLPRRNPLVALNDDLWGDSSTCQPFMMNCYSMDLRLSLIRRLPVLFLRNAFVYKSTQDLSSAFPF